MPNKWTFKIKPIRELIQKYVGNGKGWIDPFAGKYSPAEYTNDINIDSNASSHMDAKEYVSNFLHYDKIVGILFDPPYSLRQIHKSYNTAKDHYKYIRDIHDCRDFEMYIDDIKNIILTKIQRPVVIISFGWSSSGFWKNIDNKVELLIVPHGGLRYDTIVLVETNNNIIKNNISDPFPLTYIEMVAFEKTYILSYTPIYNIIMKYIKGVWLDPFYKGDDIPEDNISIQNPFIYPLYFLEHHTCTYDGIIYYPPLTSTERKEQYRDISKPANYLNPLAFHQIIHQCNDHLKPGGYIISVGHSTNMFGKKKGFKIKEIIIVNNIFIVIEQKDLVN